MTRVRVTDAEEVGKEDSMLAVVDEEQVVVVLAEVDGLKEAIDVIDDELDTVMLLDNESDGVRVGAGATVPLPEQEADGDSVTCTDATLDGEADTERVEVKVFDGLVDRLEVIDDELDILMLLDNE